MVFEYLAKGLKERERAVAGEKVCAVVRSLKRRRSGGGEVLAYRTGRAWRDVSAGEWIPA